MNAKLKLTFETDDPNALDRLPALIAGELSFRLSELPEMDGTVSEDDFVIQHLQYTNYGDLIEITTQVAIDEDKNLHGEGH